ncbi:MAG: hypothetical protein ACLGG7_13700 [Bacteriovoracia bacterium]
MTLGANPPIQTDWDKTFSEHLISHSRSLRLTAAAPVGPWTYGQGIRRAAGDTFYWELSAKNFKPLGLNHPLELRPTTRQDGPIYGFSDGLQKCFPRLAEFKWTLLPAQHSWIAAEAGKACFTETDCTLKCDHGWLGFERLEHLSTWIVPLDSLTVWVASKKPLPRQELPSAQSHQWLHAFLSSDAIGPTGRLRELAELLTHALNPTSRSGLILTFHNRAPHDMSRRGLSCDIVGDEEIRLCFPLAILSEDVSGLQKLLKD